MGKDVLVMIFNLFYLLLLTIYHTLENLVLFFVPFKWRAKDISTDIVLITGGGSGVGRELAKGFATLGCRVVVWDVNIKGNEETVREIKKNGGRAYSFICDVSNNTAVYNTAKSVKEKVGNVSILVNNAGIVTGKDFLDCPDEMIKKTMDVNALSHFWTVKAFLPDMISSNRGHIVSVASMAGLTGSRKLTDYCASKFAAVGFNESLLHEFRGKGLKDIHITTVCPVVINTGLFKGAELPFFPSYTAESVAEIIIRGVRTNQMLILLPPGLRIAMVLRWLLPSKSALVAYEITGGSNLMDGFVGREK